MTIKIVTHSGRFHADEVFAIAALKMLPEFMDAEIIRTRDANLIADADIAVDVGFDYDPDTLRFDHHQTPRPMAPEQYPYSAFGLIWKHYGPAIADEHYPHAAPNLRAAAVSTLARGFIRAIDLADNGIGASAQASLSIAIEALNARNIGNEENQFIQFDRAVQFAVEVVRGLLEEAIAIQIDSQAVSRSIKSQTDEIKDNGILILKRNLKWRDHILDHNTTPSQPRINFVLEPRSDGCWGLAATAIAADSFISHRLLPENLRGRTPEIIALLSGIQNVKFIHANGFYSCGDKDSMLALAALSVPDPRG